jgi:hypothetical protein
MPDDTSPSTGFEVANPREAPPTAATAWPVDITVVAERLAFALADQLGQISARRGPLDEARIRAYEVTRRQLAGPSDDEADTLGIGSIVSVTPPGPVTAGDSQLTVKVRNATEVDEIVFAADDGTVATNEVRVLPAARAAGDTDLSVAVSVPREAVTGPLSAVTDVGTLTYRKNVVVRRPDR